MYIDARLPKRITAGLKIGPEWMTNIVDKVNGGEKRDAKWLYPKWRARGNMGAFSDADRASFRSMFVATRGRWAAFRVFDPLDFSVTAEPLSPVIGTVTPVQLSRAYTFPGSSVAVSVRVQAPVVGSVVVKIGGTPVAGTLDTGLGLFTPSAAWAAGAYTWDGQYDHWMRFDSDWGALTANAMNAYSIDLELVEVRR
jgi:uncharacterized protein (TIGR02217 family)